MGTKNKKLEPFTFDQIKDEFIGEPGTEKRTRYELELQLEGQGDMGKQASDLKKFLITAPTYTKKQIKEIEKTRKAINQWRPK